MAAVALLPQAAQAADPVPEATLPPGVGQNWWADAQKQIQNSEYHATKQAAGLQAPNRAQNFRTYFDQQGPLTFERSAESKEDSAWKWGLTLEGWGWKGGPVAAVVPVRPTATGNTVTYERSENLREWYVNEASGLRSWYRITQAPKAASGDAPSGVLRLELSLRGDTQANLGTDGNSIEFLSDAGVRVIHYRGLKAWDAAGRELECSLGLEGEGAAQRVMLDVNAADAVFPVTIDPLASRSASWIAESNQTEAFFGQSVASAGDVNGDGYSDVIIGAPSFDNGQTNEGRAFVYLGSASGLATTATWTAESYE